ncbi:MAG TPA: hypothetical protein VGF01_08015, partial [Terracidiphilus sp.]
MSIESNAENHTASDAYNQQPPAHKGSGLRIVFYLLLVAVLVAIVWKIHQNQKLNAASTANQAAVLMGRPVPV